MMVDTYSYIFFWVCILGLCMGSFFNVVILRSLAEESIVFPPSKCPKCGNRLKWWHNIPVLSYILLRGKCYFCKEKISIQYPIIELLTMFLYALSYLKYGLSIDTLFLMFWCSCLIIMCGTDIKEKLVDCNIAIGMGISGIIYHSIHSGWHGFVTSVLGVLIGVIVLEIIARVGYIFAKTRAMGEADTYVAGALGSIFCLSTHIALLCSLVAAMIFVLPVFFYNQYKNNNKDVCILGVLFTISILLFEKVWQNFYTLIPVFVFGLWLAISVLKGVKNKENQNYLPYVPALALGSLYLIFCV